MAVEGVVHYPMYHRDSTIQQLKKIGIPLGGLIGPLRILINAALRKNMRPF